MSIHKKTEPRQALHLTKVNSKQIRDLTVKHKVVKLFKENTGEKMHNLEFGDEFLDTTSREQTVKENIDNLDCIKMKNFYSAKTLLRECKDKSQNRRKYFRNAYLITGLYTKYLKNS